MDTSEILTIKEAAAAYKRVRHKGGVQYIYNLVNMGKLQTEIVAGRKVINKTIFEKFLNSLT
jgi:hypothetical protein